LQQLLQEIDPASLTEPEWETASALALQVLAEGDFQQQWEIAPLFPKFGKGLIPPLIALLEDETADMDSRWYAGRILGQFDDSACILAFTKLLQATAEEELATMAAQSLARIGATAVKSLSQLLELPESRLLAVQALAQIRHSETIPLLLQVADDPQPAIRAAAIEALGSFHDSRTLPILLAALQDTAAAVRQEAVAALSRRQHDIPADFISQLQPLLYDLNPAVCQQAAFALGRLGTETAADLLFRALESGATPVPLKRDIILALGWSETAAALNFLEEALYGNDTAICQEIIASLGRQALPELKVRATRILQDFLASGQTMATQARIKQALATALGELGLPTAAAPIEQLAADADSRVRLHAIAALKKLQPIN
jgi:HEAT repeat protein